MAGHFPTLSELVLAAECRDAATADEVARVLGQQAVYILCRQATEADRDRFDVNADDDSIAAETLLALMWVAANCPRRRGDIGDILAVMRPV